MTTRPRIELTDDLIERMVSDRAGSRAPSDLVGAILSEAVVTPQRRARGYPRLWPTAPRARWVWVGIVLALLALGAAVVGASMLRTRTTIGGGGLLAVAQVEPPSMHVFGLDEATGDRTPIADWEIRAEDRMYSGLPFGVEASAGGGQSGWVRWSPDRRYALLFDERGHVQGIVEAASGELTPTSRLPAGFDVTRGSDQVAWAPSSDRLAALTGDAVVIAEVAGREVVRLGLPPGASGVQQPRWSPDGSSILLSGCTCGTTSEPSFASQLYVVPVDGSPVRVLLEEPFWVQDAAWSPDGSRVAYNATAEGIATLDVATGRIGVLTHGIDRHPTWAPDGRHIAFTRHDASWVPARVYVVDSDGAHIAQLSDGPDDEYPAWSPDGSLIMFERFGKTYPSVWVVAPDGDGPRLVVEDATADW